MDEQTGGAIVNLPTVDRWGQEWERVLLNAICPKGIPAIEAELFVRRCRHTGLDPLNGEAFCVPRRVNRGTREQPDYVTVYVFQPAEAGMLARAERFPDYRGTQAMAVYSDDPLIEIDAPEGMVKHKVNPTRRKGSLMGAWARVERVGRTPTVVWLELAGYLQGTDQWRKIPSTMIEKCARMAALRKAYPATFGDCYIEEELDQGGQPRTEAAQAEKVVEGKAQRTEQLTQRFRVVAPPPTVPELPETSAPRVLWYGPQIGKPIAELDAAMLSGALENADAYLARYAEKWKGHPNVEKARNGRAWVLEELEKRQGELKAPSPPKPAPEPEDAETEPPAPEQSELL
jgi:phage recombination protein Bet